MNCIVEWLEVKTWNLGRRSLLDPHIQKSFPVRGELVETFGEKKQREEGQGFPFIFGGMRVKQSLFMTAEKILVPQKILIII